MLSIHHETFIVRIIVVGAFFFAYLHEDVADVTCELSCVLQRTCHISELGHSIGYEHPTRDARNILDADHRKNLQIVAASGWTTSLCKRTFVEMNA